METCGRPKDKKSNFVFLLCEHVLLISGLSFHDGFGLGLFFLEKRYDQSITENSFHASGSGSSQIKYSTIKCSASSFAGHGPAMICQAVAQSHPACQLEHRAQTRYMVDGATQEYATRTGGAPQHWLGPSILEHDNIV